MPLLRIDEVPIAVLCDPRNQQMVQARGEDSEKLIAEYCKAINEAIAESPR